MITITTTGLDEALTALEAVNPQHLAQVIGVAVGEEARNLLATAPSASRKKQPFKSPQSRRFFFAALKRGQISVPYRRTGQLIRNWTVNPMANGALVSNSTPYAALVQSKQQQAAYHSGNWPTDQSVAEQLESSGKAADIAEEVVQAAITKAGL